jgi:polyribonucleotide nucleotidyltransferase
VIVMPLSVEMENLPDVYAVLGASAALHISDIPWAVSKALSVAV